MSASCVGALGGVVAGLFVSGGLAWVAYYFAGGASCEGDSCEDPWGYAVMTFVVLGLLSILGGGSLGCFLALRALGDDLRGLTAGLLAGLDGLAAGTFLGLVFLEVGGNEMIYVLLGLPVAGGVIFPFAARALAIWLRPSYPESGEQHPIRTRAW